MGAEEVRISPATAVRPLNGWASRMMSQITSIRPCLRQVWILGEIARITYGSETTGRLRGEGYEVLPRISTVVEGACRGV